MKTFFFNLHNMMLGVCQVADGLVAIFSFGLIHSKLACNFAFWRLERLFTRRAKEQEIK